MMTICFGSFSMWWINTFNPIHSQALGYAEYIRGEQIRHDINTRSAAEGLLVPPKTSLEVRKNFFSSRLVNDWNDLPIEVRTATSVNSFKNQYDIYHDTAKNFTT